MQGLRVAVADNYWIVWAKGYGIADLKSGRRVVAETLFQAGSISKPFAAVAYSNRGCMSMEALPTANSSGRDSLRGACELF